jgi:uncharacterized delta-60 repeat protein
MASLCPNRYSRPLLLFLAAVAIDRSLVRAQSALDGFDPSPNDIVRTVLVQPDGKILIAGDFTAVAPNGGAPVTRNRIARLNPDGSLDTGFNPNSNGDVYALALQADGKILVGGFFITIGGQARNRIARLDPATGLADSFNPDASDAVLALAVQANGKIVVGGRFGGANSIGGQARNRIARLDPASGNADSFNPNSNSWVNTIALQQDGKILLGGIFTSVGGQVRNRIARLDPATGLADSFNANANSAVNTLTIQADGKILAGGVFTSIGGQTRNRIARLNAATGVADSFDPNSTGSINTIVVQPDGKVLVGGFFNGVNSIGGQTRNYLGRLDPNTGLADSFIPNANDAVRAMAVQSDGKIVTGGDFTSVGAQTRNRIARLEGDGRPDRAFDTPVGVGGNPFDTVDAIAVRGVGVGTITIAGFFTDVAGQMRNYIARLFSDGTTDLFFNPNANARLRSVLLQADGKILVGGAFTFINGQARNGVARLTSGGVPDSFDPNANNAVFAVAVQDDSKILVGGQFTSIGGQARNRIARLDPVTGLADSFNPNANGVVYLIVPQVDGKIVAVGTFTSIGGQSRNRIARLDAITAAADSFDPNPDDFVESVVQQTDGKLVIGGQFTSIGGQTRNRIARLDPVSGAPDSFDPNANDTVYTIAVQANGRIVVGGAFTSIGGQARNRIAALDPIGLADSFNPDADNTVRALALQADGKVLVGGEFDNIGGQMRNRLARLTNDTVAQQNLMVSQTAVTWQRDGASPQFLGVTFEDSTDGSSYNFLGNGTAAGSNWVLTGLNLSLAQNLYIRARGYYSTGYQNQSQSFTETVRNAYLTQPPTPGAVVSRKAHGGVGTFDINLPLTGSSGVECRSGGANNDYQVVLTFPGAVTFTAASVTSGIGSLSSSSGSGTTTLTANLTGVTNAQRIIVTLVGVSDGTNTGNLSVPMGMLLGDVTGGGSVNSTDISQTKLQSGQAVTNANFREDVNASGSINATDVSSVKLKSGTALP